MNLILQLGNNNIAIGDSAGANLDNGSSNVFIGELAGINATGNRNVFIGRFSGLANTGDSSVFIGNGSGRNETEGQRLYIDNSNTTTPLIYGEFDNDILRVNGDFETSSQITTGGNILLNNNWLSNDGDNEGVSIDNNGLVGIGTTVKDELLNIGNDTDVSAIIGHTNIGYNGFHSDFASFSHIDHASGTNYALMQYKNGATLLNAASDQDITFRLGNTTEMALNAIGFGIGETNPQTTLDVADTAVIGNIDYGVESTVQANSNNAGLGYTTTPWLYSNAIEAQGERDAGATLITVGNDGNYGADDEIHLVTNGTSQLTVNSSGNVTIQGDLEVNGNINSNAREFVVFGEDRGVDSFSNNDNFSTLTTAFHPNLKAGDEVVIRVSTSLRLTQGDGTDDFDMYVQVDSANNCDDSNLHLVTFRPDENSNNHDNFQPYTYLARKTITCDGGYTFNFRCRNREDDPWQEEDSIIIITLY